MLSSSAMDATPRAITIVLPAFNEEACLPALLGRIRELASRHLTWHVRTVVVDDGSTDGSRHAVAAAASAMSVDLVVHERNLGLGRTLADGLRRALEISPEDAVIVTMDADDTHPVELVETMLARIAEGADVVIASRFRPGARVIGVPLVRRWISVAAALLVASLFPTRGVRDFTCGFRAYRRSALQRVRERTGDTIVSSSGFQVQCDLLLALRALRPRVVFAEVPLFLRYDRKQGRSKMRVLRTAAATLGLLLRRRLGV